ncbi:MAG: sigma-54-dependent transcriptional regulator [Thermodesulfobacteriota bacterium]
MVKERILIVEDDASMGFFLSEAMKREGYQVDVVASGEEALERVAQDRLSLVILDLKLPSMDGMEVLANIKVTNPELVVIMITAHGSKDIAIEAIRKGAYDYFTKPFDINEMRVVVKRALERGYLEDELRQLRETVEKRRGFYNIVGNSKEMRDVFDMAETVFDNDITVLITGESGTGKELIAEAIHYNSPRRAKPFVKLNCVAIPETLLESELFGYEKGAFTGATRQKLGKFELANHGTLLLDEIGDMSLATQAKLLRVLQEREVERVGGTNPIKVDVRIIASTNQDLSQLVRGQRFREDLYFRLNVLPIHIPPLRERREDIPLLVDHFVSLSKTKFHKEIERFSDDAINLLINYSWPGNIREVENVVQRAIILSKERVIQEWSLPPEIRKQKKEAFFDMEKLEMDLPLNEKVEMIVFDVEKKFITQALDKVSWKREEAASLLGISLKTLYNKMNKYGLLDQIS